MARTESTMLALGTVAPDFQLPDVVSGQTISLSTFADKKALLVMFICRHCPYVKHVQEELAKLGRDYKDTSLGIVAISANDAVNYPDDAPESLKAMATELGFTFPLCYDESQETAKKQPRPTQQPVHPTFSSLMAIASSCIVDNSMIVVPRMAYR